MSYNPANSKLHSDSEIAIEIAPGIRALPIVHGSAECTLLVRRLFLERPPSQLVLELPDVFSHALHRALPYAESIPVLTLEPPTFPPIHFIMEPLEPIVEAARSAHEAGIPIHAADRLIEGIYAWTDERFPDTYSLNDLSLSELYEMYRRELPRPAAGNLRLQFVDFVDYIRELSITERLRQLAHFQDPATDWILLVCGMKHLPSIERLLKLGPEEFAEEKKQAEVAMSAAGLPSLEYSTVDSDTSERLDPGRSDQPTDEESEFSASEQDRSPSEEVLEKEPLEELLEWNDRINSSSEEVEISILSRKHPEVLSQPGYYNTAWNLVRKNPRSLAGFDRIRLQRQVFRETRHRYERESGEIFPPQREKIFFQFARNWSFLNQKLLPDTYQLVLSARAFGNDNFARIFHDILMFLREPGPSPFQEKEITLDDLFRHHKLIRFRLKRRIKRRVPPPNITRNIQREKYPGQWRDLWDGSGICSYPPEDVVLEDFGKYLQNRAKSIMKASEEKTLEFSSSLLDGIDYRETIRNYHSGKIYVRDQHKKAIDAGSVVIIFDEDEDKHPWQVVWWGEHHQESDMAFYSTFPGDQVVGPGICRCTYGGLMLTFPPGRIHDIWNDVSYDKFDKPSDRLLLSALEYNTRNAVVHLAHKPPPPYMTQLANRLGQKIVHIPISTVNPVILGRVRRFHVLSGKEKRDDADDFIW
ncbi:MAG: hypothetical protein KDK23_02665 [Leptospiraceae bacterium]|nr:hypothetical protein [Leptospiraceae bacterium]